MYENVGKRIAEIRLEHDYHQIDLATVLDCQASTVSQYESGKRRIPLDVLVVIARTFNKPISVFFFDDMGKEKERIQSAIDSKELRIKQLQSEADRLVNEKEKLVSELESLNDE